MKMGSCYKCNTQITLKEEETRCDGCKEILRYWCNSCKKPFDVEDESTKEKLKECKTCGFFYCPACGVCNKHCQKEDWTQKIKEILGNQYYATLNGAETLKKIIEYIEEIKMNKERKTCPKGVPITYAKGRIKSLLVRMNGYRVKNIQDQAEFKKKLTEITELKDGKQITISQIRSDGSYGQEYRDALNLGVCLGLFKVINCISETGKNYSVFERVETQKCDSLKQKDLIRTECKKCNKQFGKGVSYCDSCVYVKGEHKEFPYSTKVKISNEDVCQLQRNTFIKKGENENV